VDAVGVIAAYIQTLPDFSIERLPEPSNHIGATITDAVLQAGINFDAVVRPRIAEVRRHPEARTTSGFLGLLRDRGVEAVLRWKRSRKTETVLDVLQLLKTEGVDTAEALEAWLEESQNGSKLREVKGVGPKTLEYLKILVGIPTVAPDRHLLEFLRRAGVVADFKEARSLLVSVSKRSQIDPAQLDYSIWKYMSGKKKVAGNACVRTARKRRGNRRNVGR
jgi:hypothetical protein